MKNKEKIQLLESRLNSHSQLLEKIIYKLEIDNKPQLKQLDQSVFKNMHKRWKFAAVDKNGSAYWFNKEVISYRGGFCYEGKDHNEFKFSLIGKGYDASNWQTSLIERETNELTGSELCKAMLARGDKYIMCRVNNDNNIQVISGWTFYGFTSATNKYCLYKTPIPINNQGEPLTSSDVGL